MEIAGILGFIAGIFAFCALVVLRPIAIRLNLVDRPDHRKLHEGAVPLIGGLSAFSGLILAWLILMPLTEGFGIYLLCALALVVLGTIDDAKDISAQFRLWAQVALAALLCYGSGIYLNTFGDLFGFGSISLGWLGPFVTIAAVIGATNAYNMMDGIDGLAGSMSLVSLSALGLLFFGPSGFTLELALSVTITMSLLPYMAANLRIPPFRNKIFMGDAGSMFIGFSIVWLLVNGTREDNMAFRPVTALWIIAVPLMDMVAIMVRRARKGESVMKPDRDHLHHIFMRAGFTDRQALLIITVIAILMACFGIAGEWLALPEWLMFVLFLAVFAGYERALSHAWRLLVVFRRQSVR